jgi:hypothetical protein
MSTLPKLEHYEILLGDKTKVETDARSKARFTRLPFEFPDEERGVIVLIKPNDAIWQPQNEITSVVIYFKNGKTKS